MPKKEKTGQRSKTITIRLTIDELESIKQKAQEAGLSVSEFARSSSLGQPIQHIYDGKRIAEQLARLYEKKLLYQQDMAKRVEQLQDAVRANMALLSNVQNFDSHDVCNTLTAQKEHINAVAGVLMTAYAASDQEIEEAAHEILAQIGAGDKP